MIAKVKKINWMVVWFVVVLVVAVLGVYKLFDLTRDNLHRVALQQYQKTIEHDINQIIKDRRDTSMVLALTLAEHPSIETFLCDDCDDEARPDLNFDYLVEQLNLRTRSGHVWLQVIDRKGVSLYRSWTDKVGDSVADIRRDVRQMIRAPQVQEGMSVGRFSLTFKSMVPILDKHYQLLGMVEVISHLGPLTERLNNLRGVHSVILADKVYASNLIFSETGHFIDDYYVVNVNPKATDVDVLKTIGSEHFSKVQPVRLYDGKVITQYVIKDFVGMKMGYWFTFEESKAVDLAEIRFIKKQYFYGVSVFAVLTMLLMLVYRLQRKSEEGKRYYLSILNATSEVILVLKDNRIVEANNRFYTLFSDFKNIDAFHECYPRIEDMFEESDDGLLQPYMLGQHWLAFVLEKQHKEHIAKIKMNDVDCYFRIKAAHIPSKEDGMVSIIMHDISKQHRYKKRLEYQAQTDALTGVANRLVFNKRLTDEIRRAHRYKKSLCLAMFDLDHFKQVNDNFGHDVGDEVLKTISALVSNFLRDTDVFCRIGGEEFAIIMPETDLSDARVVAERLRLSIAGLSHESVPKPMTVSMGLSHMTEWDNDVSLFKKSDRALYKAKEGGRNCIATAEDIDEK